MIRSIFLILCFLSASCKERIFLLTCSETVFKENTNNVCWFNQNPNLNIALEIPCDHAEKEIKKCANIKLITFDICEQNVFIDKKHNLCWMNKDSFKLVGHTASCRYAKNLCSDIKK